MEKDVQMREAMLYEQLDDDKVRCNLCARRCVIPKGSVGFCRVRKNIDGKLYPLNYAKACSAIVDPIGKKPLSHFHPGALVMSIATVGCNFRCQFCLDGNDMIPVIRDGEFSFAHARELDTFFGDKCDLADLSRMEIYTMNHTGPKRILYISRRRHDGSVLEIVTERGRSVKLTEDHKVPIVDEHGRLLEKRATEINVGDKLIVFSARLDAVRKIETINIVKELVQKAPRDLLENVYISSVESTRTDSSNIKRETPILRMHRNQGIHGDLERGIERTKVYVKGSRVRIPAVLRLRPRLARLIGYFLAAGRYDRSGLIIRSRSIKTLRDIEECASSLLGSRITVKVDKERMSVHFGGKLVHLLFRYVLQVSPDKGWRIPALLFNVSKNLLKEFLSAYMTCNGTLHKDSEGNLILELLARSEDIKTQLCYILSSFSIDFTLHKDLRGTWFLNIVGVENLLKLREIAVFLDGRQELIDSYINRIKMKNNINVKWRTEPVKLVRVTRATHTYVYDLTLDGDSWETHTFYAGDGILVHNCDNWVISQERDITGRHLPPDEVVKLTKKYGAHGISYTYTEPTIFFEYAYDTAVLAHKNELFNTFVTNGYMTPEAVRTIAPYLDAATVDFKGGGDPEFYRKYSAVPSVEPIFESLKEMKRHNIHIEVTNLVVPKVGDSMEKIEELAVWIKDNLGKDTPLHLLRFHPDYMMTHIPSTEIRTLEKAYETAKNAGLNYVYLGNVPGHKYENTYCPNCGELLIGRYGFDITRWRLTSDMRCPSCGVKIPIKGEYHKEGFSFPFPIF